MRKFIYENCIFNYYEAKTKIYYWYF